MSSDEGAADDESKVVLEEVFREHNSGLIRFLRRRLHSEADALEASQEAYLRLAKACDLHKSTHVKAYLFKVASNVATDMLRRRSTEKRIFDFAVFDSSIEPDQQALLDAKQKLEIVDRAIRGVSPKAREAFLLSRNEGWSTEEIAVHLKVSDRMVRIYLVKTLEHIQGAIDKAYSDRND